MPDKKKFVFECKRCGECCFGAGGAVLNEEQLPDLANFFKETIADFKKFYLTAKGSLWDIRQGSDGYCIFHNNEGLCLIHNFKPETCRRWPFLDSLIKHESSFQAAKSACPGLKTEASWENFKNAAPASVSNTQVFINKKILNVRPSSLLKKTNNRLIPFQANLLLNQHKYGSEEATNSLPSRDLSESKTLRQSNGPSGRGIIALGCKKIKDSCRLIAELIWPPICAACSGLMPLCDDNSSPARHFCQNCLKSIEFLPCALCSVCGRPFYYTSEHVCGDCLTSPPPYLLARSACVYQGAVARSISRLKYYGDLSQLGALADLVRPKLNEFIDEISFDAIIPMPISSARERERGFNQALELAYHLFKPQMEFIKDKILTRPKSEKLPQAALTAASRAKAIKSCFFVNTEIMPSRIILFDDVFTTGATAAEAAKTLLKAGASEVYIFTIARTVRYNWR